MLMIPLAPQHSGRAKTVTAGMGAFGRHLRPPSLHLKVTLGENIETRGAINEINLPNCFCRIPQRFFLNMVVTLYTAKRNE